MNIDKMKRTDFLKLKLRKWDQDIGLIDSLVLLPTRRIHDSGYMCLDFVAVIGNKPVCRLSGCSDVLNFNGIGGYGPIGYRSPGLIPGVAWNMDCLSPSGLFRLWASDHKLRVGM